jgi:hypothetical protein
MEARIFSSCAYDIAQVIKALNELKARGTDTSKIVSKLNEAYEECMKEAVASDAFIEEKS